MKTTWIEFSVPDDARTDQIAQAIEMIFKLQEGAVTVYQTPRDVIDQLRSPSADGTTLYALREAAGETVHLSYDYGQPVASTAGWEATGDHLELPVALRSPDPMSPDDEARLVVAFEPGTAIILDVSLVGRVHGPGRRLDPLVIDSEEMVQSRLAAAERALVTLTRTTELTLISPWYRLEERAAIAYARDVSTANGPGRLVAVFRPGSRVLTGFTIEDSAD